MFHEKIFSFIIIFIFLFSSQNTWSGGDRVGNSGHGILVNNNKIRLLDFVLGGVEENLPPDNLIINKRISKALKSINLKNDTNHFLNTKILEIGRVLPVLGEILILAMENYHWSFVRDFPLYKISQDQVSVDVNIPNEKIVQVAIRNGQTIRIDYKLWNKMPALDRGGLILHEVIYSFMPVVELDGYYYIMPGGPGKKAIKKDGPYLDQDITAVRDLMALLFSSDISENQRAQSRLFSLLASSLDDSSSNFIITANGRLNPLLSKLDNRASLSDFTLQEQSYFTFWDTKKTSWPSKGYKSFLNHYDSLDWRPNTSILTELKDGFCRRRSSVSAFKAVTKGKVFLEGDFIFGKIKTSKGKRTRAYVRIDPRFVSGLNLISIDALTIFDRFNLCMQQIR